MSKVFQKNFLCILYYIIFLHNFQVILNKCNKILGEAINYHFGEDMGTLSTSPCPHLRSKIVLNTPLSITLAKIFLNIINTIGPISNPIIPIILKPVYIAIKVKIG